jgi:hypothetical protein
VALGEDQVEDVRGRGDPAWQLVGGWWREPDFGLLQPRLGPTDPLGHRGLGDEERPRDLRRAQAADGAQGQRDLTRRW